MAVPFFFLGILLVIQSTQLSGKLIPFFLNGHFIAGMLLVLAPLLVIIALSVSLKQARRMTDRLMNTGLIGIARFVSIYETTRMTGDGPVMRIELEITTEIHDPYRTVYIENANLIKPAFLYPGNRFRVMVDPNEKENILINWTPLYLLNPGQEYVDIRDSRKTITPSPDSTEVSDCIPSLSM
jgi:Zn-dependent protease with chaperone function